MLKKAVQQGRSERRPQAYPLGYVEDLSDARTLLADFFSILLLRCVEVPKRRVMEFVPADLEVPLGAVEGVRSEIVEPLHGMHEGGSAVHLRGETYGIRAGDVFPSLTKTLFIQKYHGKVLDGMLFHVAVLEPGASPECC